MIKKIHLHRLLILKLIIFLLILSAIRNLSGLYYVVVFSLLITILWESFLRPFKIGVIPSLFYFFIFVSFLVICRSAIFMQSWAFIPGIPRLFLVPAVVFLLFSLTESREETVALLRLLVICYVIAALSIIYQVIYGSISWFALSHMRGLLERHSSILGSLTIYGTVVGYPLVMLYSNLSIPKNILLKILFIIIIMAAGFASLSKAAVVMIFLSVLLFILFDIKSIYQRINIKNLLWFSFTVAIFGIFILNNSLIESHYNVIVTQTIGSNSFLSDGTNVSIDSPSVSYASINKRLTHWTLEMLELYGNISYFFGIGLQGGAGVMGMNPETSVYASSHNSFGDLFFMGGSLYLIIFLILYFYTQLVLFKNFNDELCKLFFILNLLFFANLIVTSGSIFHPAISFPFWISIVYANLKTSTLPT